MGTYDVLGQAQAHGQISVYICFINQNKRVFESL